MHREKYTKHGWKQEECEIRVQNYITVQTTNKTTTTSELTARKTQRR